jgi:hypothetical protein
MQYKITLLMLTIDHGCQSVATGAE